MQLGSRDDAATAAGRSMPAVTTRDGDFHHRDPYHLAVARPVAGGTDISMACRVLQIKDPTLSLTFEQDMVVSGQTESRAEA
jgi:hypothetical protein